MLSLKQIELLYHNAPSLPIEKYISNSEFLPVFISHLQEYFHNKGKRLFIEEPFLEGEKIESCITNIFVDKELFGQIYYLVDDYSPDTSLFLYNKDFSHKYFLLENDTLDNIPIHTYYFWLGALFGIYESYCEDRRFINRKKS